MRLTPFLLLPLVALSCYTRLNHPLLREEGRAFTPDAASDCRSCHESELWLWEQDLGGYPIGSRVEQDRWLTFRSTPWWQGAPPVQNAPPALADAPPPPLAAPPDDRPMVMGNPTGSPRLNIVPPDSGATPPDKPVKPVRPPRKHNRRPVQPAQPVPPDSARKGS